jgi:hypothetical protein
VATCERLNLAFGPAPLEVQSPMIQVAPIRIDDADLSADGLMNRERLCALAGQFQEAPGLTLQAGLLDAVKAEFDEQHRS